jgi:transcriptional regulator with XRE-family HTH domain
MDPIDLLAERISERLKALNVSEREASLKATDSPDAIRYIRTRRAMPSPLRLAAIARVLHATPDWLLGQVDKNDWVPDGRDAGILYADEFFAHARRDEEAALVVKTSPEDQHDHPPLTRASADVPVYATEAMEETRFRRWESERFEKGDEWHEPDFDKQRMRAQQMRVYRNRKIGQFRDVPIGPGEALSSYGIYLPVSALDPAFEIGSSALVSLARPIGVGDFGLFFMRDPEDGSEKKYGPAVPARVSSILPKRFEVEQFFGSRFTLDRTDVIAVHRIYKMADILRP